LGAAARHLLGTITHVATQAAVAALTFDDGPHPESTPRLLELLETHRAPATFFMLGESAQTYPDLVRLVAEAGHAIGNHSWDHPSFPLVSRSERLRQVRACQSALAPYGRRLFRPPYGEQSLASRLDLLRLGYEVIAWKADVGDWWNPDASHLARLLVKRIAPGSVVLLHDTIYRSRWRQAPKLFQPTHYDRSAMLEALDITLKQLRGRFRFVTIPELLGHGPPQRMNWYRITPPENAQ
jgi:peptidoglycan/xylan/chitin deacetylase (PgdA/CDA1 family)